MPRASVGRGVDGVGILGTAAIIPENGARTVGNDEIDRLLAQRGHRPMSPDWLATMGVDRRLWTCVPGDRPAADAATTDSLLADALDATITDAGLGRHDVDMVIAATTTTSRLTTSMGAVAAGRLGMKCAAVEVRAGCASAAYGLATAYAHLAIGAGCVVVVAAETLTKVAPGAGPPAYLAGDGAAGVLLARSDAPGTGLLASWLSADGSLSGLAGPPGALPPNQADLDDERYRLVMDKRFDDAAGPWWPIGPTAVLDAAGLEAGTVDAMVMNQANRARLVHTGAVVGVPAVAVIDVVGETANAGAASMLVALDRARRTGQAGPGSTVLIAGVGGGLCAAALLLRP